MKTRTEELKELISAERRAIDAILLGTSQGSLTPEQANRLRDGIENLVKLERELALAEQKGT